MKDDRFSDMRDPVFSLNGLDDVEPVRFEHPLRSEPRESVVVVGDDPRNHGKRAFVLVDGDTLTGFEVELRIYGAAPTIYHVCGCYDAVAEVLLGIADRYRVTRIAFDRWYIHKLIGAVERVRAEQGLPEKIWKPLVLSGPPTAPEANQ